MLGEAEVGPCRQLFLEPWRMTRETEVEPEKWLLDVSSLLSFA